VLYWGREMGRKKEKRNDNFACATARKRKTFDEERKGLREKGGRNKVMQA